MPFRRLWPLLAFLILPVSWAALARDRVLAHESMDLVGHLWTLWNATLGDPTRSTLQAWPQGLDLLPIVGGWGDILLGAPLVGWLGLQGAYNAVVLFYVFLAGLGGWVLARVLGVGPGGAVVAGLLVQVDGFVLNHLMGGRPEQVGLGVMALALAGAATVWVSWELPIVLVASVAALLPFLWPSRGPGCLQRWALALGVAVVLAGPWAALFATRAMAMRRPDEGQHLSEFVTNASVGLVSWFAQGWTYRPAWPVLLCLLAVPWLVPRPDRRLWAGLGLGLVACLALALGPSPGLWQHGDLGLPWGPYTLFIHLPFLSWFHTPDRFLCTWDLAAPVAAGLTVSALGRRRALAVIWATVLLGTSVALAVRGGGWPRGSWHVPDSVPLQILRDRPGEGVVLDLPLQTHRLRVQHYVSMQLAHRRPIPHHMAIPPLLVDRVTPLAVSTPFLQWFRAATTTSPVPPFDPATAVDLKDRGYRFLVVHPNFLKDRGLARTVMDTLTTSLGRPFCFERDRWYAWDLEETGG